MENENMGPNIFETMPVGMLIWGKDILLVFGASKDTIRYVVDYMRIYCLGTVFIQLSLGLNTFITAQGFAKTSMINMTIGAVINIILDPTMIYGCDLGIKPNVVPVAFKDITDDGKLVVGDVSWCSNC